MASISSHNLYLPSPALNTSEQNLAQENAVSVVLNATEKSPHMTLTPRHTANMVIARFNQSRASTRGNKAADTGDITMYHHLARGPIAARDHGEEIKDCRKNFEYMKSRFPEVKEALGGNSDLTDGQCVSINGMLELHMETFHTYMRALNAPVPLRKSDQQIKRMIHNHKEETDLNSALLTPIMEIINCYQKRIFFTPDIAHKRRYHQHLMSFAMNSHAELVALFNDVPNFRKDAIPLLAALYEKMLQLTEPDTAMAAAEKAELPGKEISSSREDIDSHAQARQLFGKSAVRWKAHSIVLSKTSEVDAIGQSIIDINWPAILSDSARTAELQNSLASYFLPEEHDLSQEDYNTHTSVIHQGFNAFFEKEKPYVEKADVQRIFKTFYEKFKSLLVKGKQSASGSTKLGDRLNTLRGEMKKQFVETTSDLSTKEFDHLFNLFESEFQFHFAEARSTLRVDEFNEFFLDFLNSEREHPVTPAVIEERELEEAMANSQAT